MMKVKDVRSWRIANLKVHGGSMDPIKTIMVGDDLTKNEIDFIALQEVQSKEERVQALGKKFLEISAAGLFADSSLSESRREQGVQGFKFRSRSF